jgi:hypothetical protein
MTSFTAASLMAFVPNIVNKNLHSTVNIILILLSGFYIFNNKVELSKVAGPAILKKGKGDLEKIIFVLKGSEPLLLLV